MQPIGRELLPSLFALAEGDTLLAEMARRVVIIIVGNKLPRATLAAMQGMSLGQIEHAFGVMCERGVTLDTTEDYLRRYLGPARPPEAMASPSGFRRAWAIAPAPEAALRGMDAFAYLRDAEGDQGASALAAEGVLHLDFMGGLSAAARARMEGLSLDGCRGLCAEIGGYGLDDRTLLVLLERSYGAPVTPPARKRGRGRAIHAAA